MSDAARPLDDPRAQLEALEPLLDRVVDHLEPDQFDRPTPCDAFTVEGVLEHMIGGATLLAEGFGGDSPDPTPEGEVLAAWRSAMRALGAAIRAPGAFERSVPWPLGELPGEDMARYVVLDGLVHGWDLSAATGQSYDPPTVLVAAADDFARATIDRYRDGDAFADPVEAPADASPIERLAAYTGRSVPFR